MAIEIVDFPIKHGDFPVRKLLVYQAGYPKWWNPLQMDPANRRRIASAESQSRALDDFGVSHFKNPPIYR